MFIEDGIRLAGIITMIWLACGRAVTPRGSDLRDAKIMEILYKNITIHKWGKEVGYIIVFRIRRKF